MNGAQQRWRSLLPLLNVAVLIATLWCGMTQAAARSVSPTIYDLASEWTDDNGVKLRLDKWRGTPVIMAMAYTECTRICTTTLRRLEEAQTMADQLNIKIDFIVVGFDPTIDNPESWRYYRKQHHLEQRDNWHFLTGTSASTKILANKLGIEYWFDERHIMHDLKILYLNSEGQIKTFLDWDHQDIRLLFP